MTTEHLDVLIVGAGLSGIGAGYHLQTRCPTKRYAILEARTEIGGTWDLFRYPGLRSDSDMFTLGYSFRPWTDAKAIADGTSILAYVKDTAREHGIDRKIRFQQRVVSASWHSEDKLWSVEVAVGPDKEAAHYTCAFLYICSGYYNYDKGYTPDFPGLSTYGGQIIHPQHWPADFDGAGKRIVVIGSGATAVTLVPALANDAAHVTMLQRSPTYITTLPSKDKQADFLREHLPAGLAHALVRAKKVSIAQLFYQICRRAPGLAKTLIRAGVTRQLPEDYDVDRHFTPRYAPWDQRVCFVPDGDLFRVLRSKKAEIVTDTIKTFTKDGITLDSGAHLAADIVVTATGLDLLAMGGIDLGIDGARVDVAKTFTYKGLMLSNVPNFAFCVGYTNASWTLRADLSSTYVCRLLNYMSETGYDVCVPQLEGETVTSRPILDLTSGYVQRAADRFPKQGSKAPWYLRQNYFKDRAAMTFGSVYDGTLRFS